MKACSFGAVSRRLVSFLGVALVIFVGVRPTEAHRPSFSSASNGTPAGAIRLGDPDHSVVIYHRVDSRSRQLWLRTSTEGRGQTLFVQLGVPAIERLNSYRPSIAVIAGGMPPPPPGLPFRVPRGMGAKVFQAPSATEYFYEPFTGTESWIRLETEVLLPSTGDVYVVAWHPGGSPGKFWVSIGTQERFQAGDLARFAEWRRLVRQYHEVGD